MSNFDLAYANFPDFSQCPSNWHNFWIAQLNMLKKIPLETKFRRRTSSKLLTEFHLQVSFQGADRTSLYARFRGPKRLVKKPPVVIIFGDYAKKTEFFKPLFSAGFAQFILEYRGHDKINELWEAEFVTEEEQRELLSTPLNKTPNKARSHSKDKDDWSPGFFKENLDNPAKHYITMLYLDAFRVLEILRLQKEVDMSRVLIWGKGMGGALGLFISRFFNRETLLFLEEPSFFNLNIPKSQHINFISRELIEGIKQYPKFKQKQIKKNLDYLDGLYLVPQNKARLAMLLDLKNPKVDPSGGFSVFHGFETDKEMHLLTEDELATHDKNKKIESAILNFFNHK